MNPVAAPARAKPTGPVKVDARVPNELISPLPPPIAVPTLPKVPPKVWAAAPAPPKAPIKPETPEAILPTVERTGPAAAATKPNLTIKPCVPSSREPNQLTKSVSFSTNFVNIGTNSSPTVSKSSEKADLSLLTLPFVVSPIVLAISLATPLYSEVALVNLFTSDSAAFKTAIKPELASVPTRVDIVCCCWTSLNPSKPFFKLSNVALKSTEPSSASTIAIPYSSISFWASFVGSARDAIVCLKEVPAWLPLIPALAISPKA